MSEYYRDIIEKIKSLETPPVDFIADAKFDELSGEIAKELAEVEQAELRVKEARRLLSEYTKSKQFKRRVFYLKVYEVCCILEEEGVAVVDAKITRFFDAYGKGMFSKSELEEIPGYLVKKLDVFRVLFSCPTTLRVMIVAETVSYGRDTSVDWTCIDEEEWSFNNYTTPLDGKLHAIAVSGVLDYSDWSIVREDDHGSYRRYRVKESGVYIIAKEKIKCDEFDEWECIFEKNIGAHENKANDAKKRKFDDDNDEKAEY